MVYVMLVHNKHGATQFKDFSGLCFGGTRYPTDVDAFMELHDKIFMFIEMKREAGLLPQGQRLALERLTDAVAETGRQSILLIAEHDDDGDIDVAKALVREYRYNRQWRVPQHPTPVAEAMTLFVEWSKQ